MESITVKEVSMDFNGVKVLDKISFKVKKGEFVSIIGPSGCGKTTLLYLIQGFMKQTRGKIETQGMKGFVFQDHNLFPWKTLKENIEMGGEVGKILTNIGLKDFSSYYPSQISEGMKQRIGIGRCLASKSDIILMDEPFSSLDYFTKIKVQEFLIELWKKRNLTILFVTHNIDEAIYLSDRIIVMSKKPSKIVKILDVDSDNGELIKKEILESIK